MKHYIFILLLVTAVVQGKSFSNIKFTGDIDRLTGEFDRATLLKICHIEYPAIYKLWKSDPTFEEDQIKEFVENLTDYAQSMGYYRAEVNATMTNDSIYLNIKKNLPIKVTSVNMNAEFEHFALFKKSERFRTIDFTETKKKIVRYLEESGYPTYQMNAKAFVDLDVYKVDINMSIDKGVKRYFSKTDIHNSSHVDNELILEEIEYAEDELYNVLKLEESYDNIYRLGAFEKIKMEADFNNSEGKTPIHIVLEEGKTKEFASNLGYDTEEGARGGVAYIDHNFFGNLREFRAGLKVSQRGYKADTSFYDPRIKVPLLEKISFRNELGYSKWDYDSYVENLFTERVTFGKSFIGLEHFFGFQLEHSEIESGIPAFLSGNYLINSLFYRVLIDKRDSAMDAKNGYYTSLYVEKAMKEIASEIDYLKVLAEARYIKEFKPMVFAFKVKAGTISEETPPFKHFFLGGAMSNRGYEYRDLGPHSSGYPLGGLSIIDGSFESRYYVTDNFSLVGFIDASKLSEEVNDFSGDWYRSYGLGLRYLSVIGPLRLDVGYPTEGGFALHLGIGQVF
ncbi:BamA/TamA family outer membrane protein [bacterium]|nr:BamA/TamA family outer membrane protein [bacterium]MBU1959426.1 BamA/TamA family outer membrane protein [bacterium]